VHTLGHARTHTHAHTHAQKDLLTHQYIPVMSYLLLMRYISIPTGICGSVYLNEIRGTKLSDDHGDIYRLIHNITDIDQCKLYCLADDDCVIMDHVIPNTCRISANYQTTKEQSDEARHWEKRIKCVSKVPNTGNYDTWCVCMCVCVYVHVCVYFRIHISGGTG